MPVYGLLGFAGNQFELTEKIEGVSLRDHLESQWRQERYAEDQMPDQLRPVEYDESLTYLWEYFLDMNERRTSNGFGLNPIPHEGVAAWAQGRGIALHPFEHRVLNAIERVFLATHNKAKEK